MGDLNGFNPAKIHEILLSQTCLFLIIKQFSIICSDIAVGAPFDGDGKVFIYRGSDSGIETKPAQVSPMCPTKQFMNE